MDQFLHDDPDGKPADTSVTVPSQHEDTPWCDVRIIGPVQVVRDGGDRITVGFRTDKFHFFDPDTGQALR